MGRRREEYDPRIAMVSTYRPPLPKDWGKRSRWKGPLAALVLLVALPVAGLVALEVALGRDAHLPRLASFADYRPSTLSRIVATSGAVIGEVGEVRRTVVPPAQLPASLRAAVVARVDPAFLTRPSLGVVAHARAVLDRLRQRPEAPSITLTLVRRLMAEHPSHGWDRWWKEWIVARRLEAALPREHVLALYLNELPFGADRFGAEEAAQALFGLPVEHVDDAQARALAELAGSEKGPAASPAPPSGAAGCAAQAVRVLEERLDPEAISHLGALVRTSCDVELTRAVAAAIKRQRLEGLGLEVAVVVTRPETAELRAIVGGRAEGASPDRATRVLRRMGGMRVPLVLGAALESRAWTPASTFGQEGTTLRALALERPHDAAEALAAAGLTGRSVQLLAEQAGITSAAAPGALLSGEAAVTPLEVASMLSTLAAGGLRRAPLVISKIGDQAPPEGERTALRAISPEAAYLVASLLPLRRAPVKGAAALGSFEGDHDAWFGAFTPDAAVVVWVGYDGGRALPSGGQAPRSAEAIGLEALQAALRGEPGRVPVRPAGLLVRRIDAAGQPLPSGASGGAEELFMPGSLPKAAAR